MSERVVKAGLVGCGIFGTVHADAYAGFEGSELVAVCDTNAERARRVGERYGCRWYTRVEEMAGDKEVEAVSVATPDFAHREVCGALASAGKHILVEKPLAMSVADAEAIAEAVRKAGVVGMVDFHNRFHPALVTAKQRFENGELGVPQMMFARLSDRLEVATKWFSWAGKSGPEWFLGSHLVDVACWMFGGLPTRVFAEGRKDVLAKRGIDCYDSVQMHLSFAAGFATLETSWILPAAWPMICEFLVSVQGTAGRVDVDMNQQGVRVVGAAVEHPMLFGATAVGGETFGFFPYSIREFVRRVRGKAAVGMTMEEGVGNVRVLEAVRRAMVGGVVVGV